jgi:toxin ParE1/3/4
MNLPVILRRLAQAEFDDAADWYESQRAGRGAAFTAAVREVLADLGSRPEAHPEVYGDVREALVARYPYAVYYRPEPGQITVLAIFHTSRDPAEWQRRASP